MTTLQYPSTRSAMFSAAKMDGQVTVRSSGDPATFSCRQAFGAVSEGEEEDDDDGDDDGCCRTVWMDWTWLKSAMWVGWRLEREGGREGGRKEKKSYVTLIQHCPATEVPGTSNFLRNKTLCFSPLSPPLSFSSYQPLNRPAKINYPPPGGSEITFLNSGRNDGQQLKTQSLCSCVWGEGGGGEGEERGGEGGRGGGRRDLLSLLLDSL